MDVGVVRVAEDQDFERLKNLLEDHNGWKEEYNKNLTRVWSKSVIKTNFKMIKVTNIFSIFFYSLLSYAYFLFTV